MSTQEVLFISGPMHGKRLRLSSTTAHFEVPKPPGEQHMSVPGSRGFGSIMYDRRMVLCGCDHVYVYALHGITDQQVLDALIANFPESQS